MENILFDIECCNGRNICSFGYVVFDDNFNILENKDIVINPQKSFRLGNKNEEPRISLAYSEEEFRKADTFDKYYQTIKSLFKGRRLFAHSAPSDIMFLSVACERYNLEPYDIKVLDTQQMYKTDNPNKKLALEDIVKDLQITFENLSYHKSSDDARISMEVLKELIKRKETTLNEYIKTHNYIIGMFDNYKNKIESNRGVIKYLKELKSKYNKNSKNRVIEISEDFKLNIEDYKKFLKYAYTHGYRVSHNMAQVNYFVIYSKESKRYKLLEENKNQKRKVTYFDKNWLYSKIHDLAD